jgi:large subunit ribosomal protein L4e|tara:strand:+ start:1132 stop:1908 length:777 start_codon:yes stop_codon:yes gene_type:complete
MKLNVYSISGKVINKTVLPDIFEDEVRVDLIKRAVIASQSSRYQPQGVDWFAGKRTSAYSYGAGHAVSRVPRVKGSRHAAGGKAAIVPQAVGGRSAHPPNVNKKIKKLINRKERLKATRSAIAATANRNLVLERGHLAENVPGIPLIVENKFESLNTTKKSKEAFENLGLWDDVIRAKNKNIRAGKGTMRGRKYKIKKSPLIVIANEKGLEKGARNLPGVDVVNAMNLSVEHLAPGARYGRLTVYTKNAISKLKERFI